MTVKKRNMQTALCTFLLLIVPLSLIAQITFEKWYGGQYQDWSTSVLQIQDGGYAITGCTQSFGSTGLDILFLKTDSLGDLICLKTYRPFADAYGTCIVQNPDKGFAMVGIVTDVPLFSLIFMMKTDSTGDSLWTKYYIFPINTFETAWSMVRTADNGYAMAGKTNRFTDASDGYLVKTDSLGDTLWTKYFATIPHKTEEFFSITNCNDGGYAMAGRTNGYSSDYDFFVVKTDSNGNKEWEKVYGDSDTDNGRAIIQTLDGGFIVAGETRSYGSNPGYTFDLYLVKIDVNGDVIWDSTYGGIEDEACRSVNQTTDGGYIIAGHTHSFGAGVNDVYLVKIDSIGNLEWQSTYGGAQSDGAYDVKQTSDSGYIITGLTKSYGAGISDVYIVKTDPDGNVAEINEKKKGNMWDIEDLDFHCQPNPFIDRISIYLWFKSEPWKMNVGLFIIHDISGREIKRMRIPAAASTLPIEISWDGKDNESREVPVGVYFLQLQAGENSLSQKLIKVR